MRGSNAYCLYVIDVILGKELSKGVTRGRKGDKHYRASWSMEI